MADLADADVALGSSPHELFTTGERIRWLRHRHAVSQRQLAAELGISFQALGNYERDERPLPGEVARLLALRFKVSTDYLLRLKATPPYITGKGGIRRRRRPLQESRQAVLLSAVAP